MPCKWSGNVGWPLHEVSRAKVGVKHGGSSGAGVSADAWRRGCDLVVLGCCAGVPVARTGGDDRQRVGASRRAQQGAAERTGGNVWHQAANDSGASSLHGNHGCRRLAVHKRFALGVGDAGVLGVRADDNAGTEGRAASEVEADGPVGQGAVQGCTWMAVATALGGGDWQQ